MGRGSVVVELWRSLPEVSPTAAVSFHVASSEAIGCS
jgi:hypothetical protein